MLNKLNGSKTYLLGIGLLAWIAASVLLPENIADLPAPDENAIAAILAAMGLTIRHGLKTGAK